MGNNQHFCLVLHLNAIYVQEFIQELKAAKFDGEAGIQHALGAIQHHTLADASERGVVAILVPTLYLYHPLIWLPDNGSQYATDAFANQYTRDAYHKMSGHIDKIYLVCVAHLHERRVDRIQA